MSWFASRRSKIEHHQRSTLARHHHHHHHSSHRAQDDKSWTSSAIAREKWLESLFHEQEVLLGDHVKRGVFSRLPKTPLLTLSLITLFIHFLANRTTLLPIQLVGQTGATMTAALSMTTGLLMSYRSSTALAKWGKGKGVWGGIKAEVRDVLRQLSALHPTRAAEPVEVLKGSPTAQLRRLEQARALNDKAGELACLFIAFGFALHHHLTETRPLIQRAPLCDILPSGYVESKSRTRNRVRFASGGDKEETSQTSEVSSTSDEESSSRSKSHDDSRSDEDSEANVLVDGDISDPDKTRPIELKKLVGRASLGPGHAARKRERDVQLKQLNIAPSSPSLTTDYNTYVIDHQPGQPSNRRRGPTSHLGRSPSDESSGSPTGSPTTTTRSSLSRTVPSNLPLDILRMIESYVNSLHLAYQIDSEVVKTNIADPLSRLPFALGHSIPQSEKLHKSLRTLSKLLGEAEMLSEDPPPLSLSIHLNHLVMLYLLAIPAQVMPILGRYSVFVVLIAGWALLGVEALCREVGTVFGSSENHLPTRTYAVQMLNEALDTCPLFLESYRGRLEERLQLDDTHAETDKGKKFDTTGSAKAIHRAREEEMLKSLERRRRDEWVPNFKFERWADESFSTPSSSDSSWAKPSWQGKL